MFDLHMHILPGVDDGAATWEDALAMAAMAVEAGVRGVVATSHGNLGDLTIEKYARTFYEFRKKLEEEKIPLLVYPGMEIYMDSEAGEKLRRQELLTINNSRYALVEFNFGEDLWTAEHELELLEMAGYIPVIAHVERYAFVQKNPQAVFDWVLRGYVIQVNKGSFLGAFGRREQDLAMSLLEHNLVHAVASDAHGIEHRTPAMGSAVRFLSEYISEEYLDMLFEINPIHILKNEEIEAYRPIPYGQDRYR